MSAETRWWWIRHAPVDSGGRIYGQTDPEADCGDLALFAALATRLPRDAVWITSQLRRTRQTADAIGAHLAAPLGEPHVEPRFAEQDFGDWHGMKHEELRRERHPAWHRFWLAPAHETPPGGESFAALIARVRDGIEQLSDTHRGRDIVCVAHGGSIRAALAIALEIEPERALSFSIDNCSLTRLDHISGSPGSHAPEAATVWRIGLVNYLPQTKA